MQYKFINQSLWCSCSSSSLPRPFFCSPLISRLLMMHRSVRWPGNALVFSSLSWMPPTQGSASTCASTSLDAHGMCNILRLSSACGRFFVCFVLVSCMLTGSKTKHVKHLPQADYKQCRVTHQNGKSLLLTYILDGPSSCSGNR